MGKGMLGIRIASHMTSANIPPTNWKNIAPIHAIVEVPNPIKKSLSPTFKEISDNING